MVRIFSILIADLEGKANIFSAGHISRGYRTHYIAIYLRPRDKTETATITEHLLGTYFKVKKLFKERSARCRLATIAFVQPPYSTANA